MTAYSIEHLKNFIPEQAYNIVHDWIITKKIKLNITSERKSKNGDYRSPYKDNHHRISINGSLNKYAFLITLVHEYAHLLTWEKSKKALPHGIEWKKNYKEAMEPFFKLDIFPSDIKNALSNYLVNPAASTSRDFNLSLALKNYDSKIDNLIILDQLEDNREFIFPSNNKKYIKLNKLSKRIKCIELDSKRTFLFNPICSVIALDFCTLIHQEEKINTVANISNNSLFKIKDKSEIFKKINKIRTRVKCLDINSGLYYSFSENYPIIPI